MQMDSRSKIIEIGIIKIQCKLAMDEIKKDHKNIYKDIIFTNEIDIARKKYNKFFGYIKKSRNAKKRWKDLDLE